MPEQAVKPCSKKPSASPGEAKATDGFFQQGIPKAGIATVEGPAARKTRFVASPTVSGSTKQRR
ncbi:protein of unknown function (plasmid) [Caballeronia sp. S22]